MQILHGERLRLRFRKQQKASDSEAFCENSRLQIPRLATLARDIGCGLRARKTPLFAFRLGVFAAEALHSARGINQFLFAGEERVAVRADFHRDIALMRGTCSEIITARAMDAYRFVCGMNTSLHDLVNLSFIRGFRGKPLHPRA